MDQEKLKNIWKASIEDSGISIDKNKMLSFFEKSRSQENLMRAIEFSDLFGGIILFFLFGLVYFKKPEIITSIPLLGQVGASVFLFIFALHHVLSFKIKLKTFSENHNLKELLVFQMEILNARINLLKAYKWFLLIGLSGMYLLFYSLAPDLTNGLLSFLLLGTFGIVIYYLAMKKLNNDFLPLKKETEEKLASLE